jgi:hypothetical protein
MSLLLAAVYAARSLRLASMAGPSVSLLFVSSAVGLTLDSSGLRHNPPIGGLHFNSAMTIICRRERWKEL